MEDKRSNSFEGVMTSLLGGENVTLGKEGC